MSNQNAAKDPPMCLERRSNTVIVVVNVEAGVAMM